MRLYLLFAFCFVGCTAGPPCIEGRPVDDVPLADALRARAGAQFPESFRVLLRGLVQSTAGDLDFTAYVMVSRPHALRMVAMTDFGGTLFDLQQTQPGKVNVVQNTSGLPDSFLTEGLFEDVRCVFLKSPSRRAALYQLESGEWSLRLGEQDFEELTFDPQSQRPVAVHHASSGICWRQLRLDYDGAMISGYRAEHFELGYTARLIVLELHAGPVSHLLLHGVPG